ncbi:MAG: PAS domain-containing protein [Candidatus Obscuribacterales bacterium]|nr:PAS domain-containing protein [Candidatus Obscuribacterales bacterium]
MACNELLVKSGLDENTELSDFFENAPIGMLWIDAEGTVLKANKYKLEMLGYNEAEFVGHNIAEFHPDKNNLQQAFAKITNGENLQNYPVGLLCKDGSVKQLLLNSNGRFDNSRFVHTRCVTRPAV